MTLTHFPFQNPVDSPDFNQRLDEIQALIDTVMLAGSGTTTTLTAQALSGQANLSVASVATYVGGDAMFVGHSGSGLVESHVIDSINVGALTVTLEDNLANTHAIGTPVSRSPAEIVNARSIFATLGDRLDVLRLGLFPVTAYGAVGDGVADDTTAIQNAITAAFAAPGGTVVFPPGDYKVTSTLSTPGDTAGAIKLLGLGRPRSLAAGHSGDPVAKQGVTITYTGATGDIFLTSVATGNKRVYVTIEGIYFQGNVASGTSGHGLHFLASAATVAVLVTLRDVTVNGAKQHGIFFDGNVFECQLFNVRSNQNGLSGFVGAANAGTVPGEVRLYGCTFNVNGDNGVQWAGGGGLNFFGLTCTQNTNEGLEVSGAIINGVDLTLEINGTAAGQQALFTSAGVRLFGVGMTPLAGGTGFGMRFVGALWNQVHGYFAGSSVTGVGYKDIAFDNTSSRCTVANYNSDDFVDRIDWGTGGGHMGHRGGQWMTGQYHGQQTVSSAVNGNDQFDATKFDSFRSVRTASGIQRHINNPTMGTAFHDGQRVTVTVFNNSAGATTTTWETQWHLAGAWVDPATTKTRTITFEWDATRSAWYEISRSAADIT